MLHPFPINPYLTGAHHSECTVAYVVDVALDRFRVDLETLGEHAAVLVALQAEILVDGIHPDQRGTGLFHDGERLWAVGVPDNGTSAVRSYANYIFPRQKPRIQSPCSCELIWRSPSVRILTTVHACMSRSWAVFPLEAIVVYKLCKANILVILKT